MTLRHGGVLVQYMSDRDKQDAMETLLDVGFTDSVYLFVDIESFFGAGACFMVSVKSATQSLTRRFQSLQTNLADFAPKGGWSYLTSESLSQCVSRNARRLQGGGSGSGSSDSGSRASTAFFVGGHTGYHSDSDHCKDNKNKEKPECNCDKAEYAEHDDCKPPPVWVIALVWTATVLGSIFFCFFLFR